jgi:hypothetical protein
MKAMPSVFQNPSTAMVSEMAPISAEMMLKKPSTFKNTAHDRRVPSWSLEYLLPQQDPVQLSRSRMGHPGRHRSRKSGACPEQ